MIKKLCLPFLIAIYFVIAYTLLNYFDITCVFLKLTGIPCPGCGMTRALLAVLNMDIISAVKYNVVIFFMPYVFLYIFLDLKNKVHNILLLIIAIVAIINWLIKISLFI